jgi:hypothetical protein
MAEGEEARSGSCQCGRVRFEAAGKPIWVAHCHCTDCRRATASAQATYAGYDKGKVRFTAGEPAQSGAPRGCLSKARRVQDREQLFEKGETDEKRFRRTVDQVKEHRLYQPAESLTCGPIARPD